jgi:hypothetical protein
MNQQNPVLDEYLPELMRFIRKLSEGYVDGTITSEDTLTAEVAEFFDHARQAKTEQALPGWTEMAGYADGVTQVHTISVMIAIMTSPGYENASAETRNQMAWSGLLHDISKRVVQGQLDLTHAFRSGAQAVRSLLRAGFLHQEYADLEGWIDFTKQAVKEEDGREIQDNAKLPGIIKGMETIFGGNKDALIILKTILFHWSITTIKEWPPASPITPAEVRTYLDEELLQVLGVLLLADSDSWNLFDIETKERYREEIAEALTEIGAMLAHP